MRFPGTVLVVFIFFASFAHSQESYQVDLSQIEKEIAATAAKPYSLGGFLEFQPILFGLDRDSTVSRIQFFDKKQGSTFDQYNFRLRLEGSYKRNPFSAFFKTDTRVRNDFDGWDEDIRLFEAYASFKPVPNVAFEAGKKVAKWGKGYAWNAVSFIAPPKNPRGSRRSTGGIYTHHR
jgi:hypothetical protein